VADRVKKLRRQQKIRISLRAERPRGVGKIDRIFHADVFHKNKKNINACLRASIFLDSPQYFFKIATKSRGRIFLTFLPDP
jgi:hypothetical protein